MNVLGENTKFVNSYVDTAKCPCNTCDEKCDRTNCEKYVQWYQDELSVEDIVEKCVDKIIKLANDTMTETVSSTIEQYTVDGDVIADTLKELEDIYTKNLHTLQCMADVGIIRLRAFSDAFDTLCEIKHREATRIKRKGGIENEKIYFSFKW